MIRRHVVQAIFRRNFVSYFSSPTGYVFISVFVALSSAMAFWPQAFWTNNLANVDTLNRYFPYLLLFFVPAVAMAIWAEERKQGTDELLLTLPARDTEIVLGKYLATFGIYTVALLFSLTHVVVLAILGSPDIGVMFGTYVGYGLAGGALLAVAMTASLLTSSQTIAFIMGALFCALPVFLGDSGAVASGRLQGWLEGLGVKAAFDDLSRGVLSVRALFYFFSLAAFFLYLNFVILTQRRSDNRAMWGHYLARSGAIVVLAVSIGILAGRAGCRADLTTERLYSLSDPTREVLAKVDAGRPVLIQAYVSPEVPENYVETRKNLLDLLREYDAMAGDRVEVRIVSTQKYSAEALQAEEQFGIKSERVSEIAGGRFATDEIFMGVAFTCGAEQLVIPFFYRGFSVEYELTRSIGSVSGAKRRRIAVAQTDAQLFGGFDMGTMSSRPEWQILSELKKQYEVVQASLDSPLTDRYDALLVAQVSSLTQAQMDNLLAYVKKGNPTLLYDDPQPYFNPALAPTAPKNQPRGMMGMMAPPQGEPKGDIDRFLSEIGLVFGKDTIIWDTWNPHPAFEEYPPEILWIGKDRFHAQDPISSGLQEMALIFSGEVSPRGGASLTFTPLLKTTIQAGVVSQRDIANMNPFQQPRRRPRGQEVTLAARVKGTVPPPAPGNGAAPAPPAEVNAVFCADLDSISNTFFGLRQAAPPDLNLDNVTFVLNCVDVLAGDESYVALRKRRPKHRTLETVEKLSRDDEKRRQEQTKSAEEKAEKELKDAQARLDAKVEEIRNRKDIDERQRDIQIETVRQAESKKFEGAKREIEDRKKAEIERSVTEKEQARRAIEIRIRNLAVFLPPIPPLLIGLYFWFRRLAAQGRTV